MATKATNATEATVPAQPGPAPIEQLDLAPFATRALVVAGYVGAALLSFVPPLALYTLSRRAQRADSAYLARHAAQALNTAVTTILYGLCSAVTGGLLTLDSPSFGIGVAVTGALFFWVLAAGHLVSAATAAARGRRYQIPLCLCADFTRLTPGP